MDGEKDLICRSTECIETSILSIFNLSKNELMSLLLNDYEEAFNNQSDSEDAYFSEFIYRKVFEDRGIPLRSPNRIHWYHGTRCFNTSDFNNGIQPLNQAFPRISAWIDKAAETLGIKKQVPSRENHSLYLLEMKLANSFHWGPFAMLNRDALINPEQYSCYCYTQEPEIVRDYINTYYLYARKMLGDFYHHKTHSCIVEFWTPSTNRQQDTIETALLSLYYAYHNQPQHLFCNTCYDGKGIMIPRNQIIAIEDLE